MRKIKKGIKGEASQYLTRSNAIRALQVNLQDFRKLCILKGIYPRQPNKRFKGNDKTYFHVKDVKILQHDQLLAKFRSIKAHIKKHKKYLGRREVKTAEAHIKKTPKLSLAPVIKDRYPTFVDALRDLDDSLCLISLYAQLPQHLTLEVSKNEITTCARLYKEFMMYCTVSQCFSKAFFSIKGIYYRVEIMGQPVTWVQPYKFNQRMPFDIDYKVMGTFTEFYMALLKFVNFKLYSDLGLPYPMAESDLPVNGEFYKSAEMREMQSNARKLFD
jgi:pescadillo protein